MAIQDFTAGQVLTAVQMDNLQANDYNQTVSTKTASYTLVAADKGTRIVMNSASATTITVNTSLFSAGDTLILQNISTGVCTVTAGTATVSTAGSLAIPQNGSGTLYFTSAGVSIFYPSAATATASGLVLVQAETSFSAASSYSANNVFTSTYRNYRIIFNTTEGAGSVTMKLRAAGTDTTTNYNSYNVYGTSANLFANNALGTDEWYLCDMTTAADGSGFGVIDILGPQVAFPTTFSGQFYGASGADNYFYVDTGRQNSTTQFDGFTILSTTTGMTGTYTVYGYSK